MSYQVRKRESLIFDSIFRNLFKCETIHPQRYVSTAGTEGGDTLIARHDTLFIGTGSRTNKNGINFLVEKFRKERPQFNILVQELPQTPESFIHLDMVFTFLDKHYCMAYKPIIAQNLGNLHTYHIKIDNGEAKYIEKTNFLQGLKDLGFDMKPISCGGDEYWNQQREQWHSGANFFALDQGKVIGYSRNNNTIEAMNNAGFEVLKAADVVAGKDSPFDHKMCVVTFDACELPRGGGGARCMTMPVNRDEVEW
jgi:arginine deiminase